VQNVAQGYLVYELTRDPAKLAMVTLCGTLPVAIIGPFAGTLADVVNRRVMLVAAQACFATTAMTMALLTYTGLIQYWHFLVAATFIGIVACIEMPLRQSVVSKVVPKSDLAAAIPLNAMTFNFARLFGPAIGGQLLEYFGPHLCYFVNGCTFSGLIFAALAIRADLRATQREPQPVKDLLFEGMRYTIRDPRLRTIFILEVIVSAFGLAYLALMPAIARDQLGLGKVGLGHALSAIGIGALVGLVMVAALADKPIKATIVRSAMTALGLSLLLLSQATNPYVAFVILALAGASGVAIFNTCNALFQLLSPARLRGRVLSMHVWALSGVGPLLLPAFGWIAREYSTQMSVLLGGAAVLVGAAWGWTRSRDFGGVG
jgi:MFS family permease